MPTTLYLIRHGITSANKENRFAGRSAEPLHGEGAEQIRKLAASLQKLPITKVYCGPLPRTWQSAEIIAQVAGVAQIAKDGLNEIDLPHWDGLTKDEIRCQFGEQYPTWLAAPQDFRVTGCEFIAQVQERATRVVEEIFQQHQGETLVIVSHLIVLRALVLYYRQMGIDKFRTIKIANGSLTRLSRVAAQTAVELDIACRGTSI